MSYMGNVTRESMVKHAIALMDGSEEPTRRVVDWLNDQRERRCLTMWERSAIGMASASHDRCAPPHQLNMNVREVFSVLWNACDADADKAVLSELRDEIVMISEWLDAFDLIEASGGRYTSEEFNTMLPYMYILRIAKCIW